MTTARGMTGGQGAGVNRSSCSEKKYSKGDIRKFSYSHSSVEFLYHFSRNLIITISYSSSILKSIPITLKQPHSETGFKISSVSRFLKDLFHYPASTSHIYLNAYIKSILWR